MPAEQIVTVPMDVEYAFAHILGKTRTHGLAGHLTERQWSKRCSRLLVELGKYVEQNVTTDERHYRQIREQLERLQKSTLDGTTRESGLFAGLIELCLLLMGDLPDHWNKKAINRSEYFRLDASRTLHYAMTWEQKANLIIRTHFQARLQATPKDLEAHEKATHAIFKPAEFVESFRKSNPEDYAALF